MSSVDIILFTFKTVVNTTFQNVLKDYKYKNKGHWESLQISFESKNDYHTINGACFTVYLKFGKGKKYTILICDKGTFCFYP